MKLYMFQTVPLSIIRSLFTLRSAIAYTMSYRFVDSFRAGPGPARKLSTVGFIIKKFVTLHGHMNVKK